MAGGGVVSGRSAAARGAAAGGGRAPGGAAGRARGDGGCAASPRTGGVRGAVPPAARGERATAGLGGCRRPEPAGAGPRRVPGDRAMRGARAATLAAWAVAISAGAYPVETLIRSGPSSQRLDLVILGDGYREQDQEKLSYDARRLVKGLFGITPYQQYLGLVNVKLVHVVSNQNGADRGSYGAVRDTALGSFFYCADISTLLCVDYDLALNVAAQDAPDYD